MKTNCYQEVKDKYYQEVKSFLKRFLEKLMYEERMIYLQDNGCDKGNGYYERDLLTAYGNIEGFGYRGCEVGYLSHNYYRTGGGHGLI